MVCLKAQFWVQPFLHCIFCHWGLFFQGLTFHFTVLEIGDLFVFKRRDIFNLAVIGCLEDVKQWALNSLKLNETYPGPGHGLLPPRTSGRRWMD